jgi:non-specific serine/threonine protein kinase
MSADDPVRPHSPHIAPQPAATRSFGRYTLLRLLGKSVRSMLWLVLDPRSGQELMLAVPRQQPISRAQADHWLARARQAARVKHPGLAEVVDIGEQDRWPYMAYERGEADTLAERLAGKGLPAVDTARWALKALSGLAFAHEAGLAHRDLQPWHLLLDDQSDVRIVGLGVAYDENEAPAGGAPMAALQSQRAAAERDVLAFGLLLHLALAGHPALDQPDIGQAIALMPPLGREIVRLPFAGTRTVPEPLRAIVNRATDRQERQRYRNARTLARALDGWLAVEDAAGGGPLALLLDRLRSVGLLPTLPGSAARAARMALMERERTIELAEIVMEDPALSFEMLRAVNTASVRGSTIAGDGPVLTIRRAIAMVGLDGVRRCTFALREWPGPLGEGAAGELQRAIDRAKHAGRIAQMLRPRGFDAEVIYLVALLQNLGRLVVQYHFPDEALQIRRLMQPAPAQAPGERDEPGMSEEGAAFAVLGVGIEELGVAVARHWGFDDTVLPLVRRLPLDSALHVGHSDDEQLRTTASCANEVVDALQQPAAQALPALQRVANRYARLLEVSLRDLQLAAQGLSPGDPHPDATLPPPELVRAARARA